MVDDFPGTRRGDTVNEEIQRLRISLGIPRGMVFSSPDPVAYHSRWTSEIGAEISVLWNMTGGMLYPGSVLRHHSWRLCAANLGGAAACPLHSPSDHGMRGMPLSWRYDKGIMERVCSHGIGHPDPDDLSVSVGASSAVHGCDGCCGGKNGRS